MDNYIYFIFMSAILWILYVFISCGNQRIFTSRDFIQQEVCFYQTFLPWGIKAWFYLKNIIKGL